jgi:hypothetical protein
MESNSFRIYDLNKDIVRYKYIVHGNNMTEKNLCSVHIGKSITEILNFQLGDRLIIRKSPEYTENCKMFVLEKSLFGNVLRPYSTSEFSNFVQVFFAERIRKHFKLPKNKTAKNIDAWIIDNDQSLLIKFP